MPDKIPATSAEGNLEDQALKAQFAAFGDYDPALEYDSTGKVVAGFLRDNSRPDVAPAAINPWECRIGGSKFYVPPISVKVSQAFDAGSLNIGSLRQKSSPKGNSGHSETIIEMDLYFPNADTIWGYEGSVKSINFDDPNNHREVDTFMSSLRGLITQFKYTPFLPIKNAYINGTYDITGVVLKSMTVGTLEGFPFCLTAHLVMYKFNHEVYMPMVGHFEDAIHWGKFRQYIGRAAKQLASTVDYDFLTTESLKEKRAEAPKKANDSLVSYNKYFEF